LCLYGTSGGAGIAIQIALNGMLGEIIDKVSGIFSTEVYAILGGYVQIMVISTRKIILIVLGILTAVFAGMNFQYSWNTRIILTLVFIVVNVFSFLYAEAHWTRLRTSKYTQFGYFLLFVLMETALWVFYSLTPTSLTGVLSWIWIGAISICFFGVLLLIAICDRNFV